MVRRFETLPDRTAVEKRVAGELVSVVLGAIEEKDRADILITGGTVGIGTLAAVAQNPDVHNVDWSRVHVWWGDERFVVANSPERNEQQARDALFSHIDIPNDNLHVFPADHGQALDEARDEFLGRYSGGFPSFDVALNGIGLDGHVASLFPGLDHGTTESVIAVHDSPKPPANRLSFTFAVLNSAQRVWIVAAGEDKADAIGKLAVNNNQQETPATALRGALETVVWLDAAAASQLSD
jgi:6-phosphogluconolactonase